MKKFIFYCTLMLITSVQAMEERETAVDSTAGLAVTDQKYDDRGMYEPFRFGTFESIQQLLTNNPPRSHHAGYIVLNLIRNYHVTEAGKDKLVMINNVILDRKKCTENEKIIVDIINATVTSGLFYILGQKVNCAGYYEQFMCKCAREALERGVPRETFSFFVENGGFSGNFSKIIFQLSSDIWRYWLTLPFHCFKRKNMRTDEFNKVVTPYYPQQFAIEEGKSYFFSSGEAHELNEENYRFCMARRAIKAGNLEAYRILKNDPNVTDEQFFKLMQTL